MKEINVKTKFAGRVWVHERYITYIKGGGTLVIKHQDQQMTVTPKDIQEVPPQQGKEPFTEQFGKDKGKKYYLYGFLFSSDDGEVIKPKKKKEALVARGIIAQCPDCKYVKVSVLSNRKEKLIWQGCIVLFENKEIEKCPPCIAKS